MLIYSCGLPWLWLGEGALGVIWPESTGVGVWLWYLDVCKCLHDQCMHVEAWNVGVMMVSIKSRRLAHMVYVHWVHGSGGFPWTSKYHQIDVVLFHRIPVSVYFNMQYTYNIAWTRKTKPSLPCTSIYSTVYFPMTLVCSCYTLT